MSLDIQEIMRCLPHRYPFLLVDRILAFEEWKSIHALKNVTINEPFFQGHFPGIPVMPGVLIVEALAQAAGLVIVKSDSSLTHEKNLFLLAGVDGVRFKRMVVPGDQLQLYAKLIRSKHGVYKFQCEARVDDEIACVAEVTNIMRTKS